MKKVITFLSIGVMLITVSCQKQIDKPADLSQSKQANDFPMDAYLSKTAAYIKTKSERLNELSARALEKSKTTIIMAKRPPRGTTINVPGDYASIQEAVDNAPNGAIINVTGSYIESIYLSNKSNITINGGGTANLTRSPEVGDGYAIQIVSSNGIVFKGFNILGGMVLAIESNQIEISNNDISGIGDGIEIVGSDNCTIRNNTVHDNYYDDTNDGIGGHGEGILLFSSNNNTVSNNQTNNNVVRGITLIGSSGNSIQSNVIANEGEGGIGIFPFIYNEIPETPSNSNAIQMNEVTGTSVGILLSGEASSNVLKDNRSKSNFIGLALDGSWFGNTSRNKISVGDFTTNSISGVVVGQNATSNTIVNTNASGNASYGFRLYPGSANNTIRSCTATANGTCDYWDQGTNNASMNNTFGIICN